MRWGQLLVPQNYQQINLYNQRMLELQELIMLAMAMGERQAQKELEREFGEIHGKYFFASIAINSFFLVLIAPYIYLVHTVFAPDVLWMPPVNFVFAVLFVYIVLKIALRLSGIKIFQENRYEAN